MFCTFRFHAHTYYINWFDNVSLGIYCIEMVIRIIVGRKRFWVVGDTFGNYFDLIITILFCNSGKSISFCCKKFKNITLVQSDFFF